MADDSGASRAAGSDDDDSVGDAAAQWNDWREDAALGQAGEEESAQSLFSAAVLPSAAAAIAHDREQHAFDMAHFAAQRRLDEYGVIRCINFIRSEVAAGRDPRAQLASPAEPPPWAAEQYLQPVLPDDALLMHDFGDEHPVQSGPVTQQGSTVTAFDELARLRAHNEALREALATSSGLPALQDLREDGGAERDSMAVDMRGSTAAAPLRTAATAADTRKRVSFSTALATEAGRVDDTYFDSYSYFDIHHEMLGDKARTEAYRDALEQNPWLLHGATVLDVGCGTGILSLFAARSGAARVIGVDGSERIAGFARQIAAKNALDASAGGPVSIVTGKVEELAALPGGMQVDVLVSEWMGYALLFESMLDSVLHARDRFLKPGGAVLPDLATLHVAGGGARAGGLDFWDDVYGFDMSPVAAALQQAALRDAVVAPVRAEDLVTPSMPLRTFDLATMAPGDADFTADFRLQPEEGDRESVACHSVVLWFDVEFSTRFCVEHAVRLTTSPHAPQTHWAQVILSFREPIPLHPPQHSGISHGSGGISIDDGLAHAVAITGQISIARSSKHRALDISLTYRPVFADGHASAWEQTSFFEMGVSG